MRATRRPTRHGERADNAGGGRRARPLGACDHERRAIVRVHAGAQRRALCSLQAAAVQAHPPRMQGRRLKARKAARLIASAALACALQAVAGCESDTDIRGELVPEEPVPIDVRGTVTAVGLLDDWVLVTSVEQLPPRGEPWGDIVYETFVTWVSPTNEVGEPMSLGWSRQRDVPRWIAWDGALWGSITAAQDTGSAPPLQDRYFRVWGLRPTGVVCTAEPILPVVTDDFVGTAGFDNGLGGSFPAVLTQEGPAFLLSANPAICGNPATDFSRALVVRGGCTPLAGWLPNSPTCERGRAATSLTAWPLWNGLEFGVLSHARAGSVEPADAVSFQRFSLAGQALGARLSASHRIAEGGVRLPTGVAAGQRVLFLDGSDIEPRCAFLRRVNWDGTGHGDAPWQMPCVGTRPGPFGTTTHVRDNSSADLVPFADMALLTLVDAPRSADDADPARGLVVAMTLRGQRASNVLSVAALPVGALVATTDASQAIVAMYATDGWYLRRIRWVGGLHD